MASLAIAAPISIALFYFLLWGMSQTNGDMYGSEVALGYAIWVAIPYLFAYGVPAMLVGNEEESGTLGWLRTLPASWGSIVMSKLFVAFGFFLVTWLFSTIAYFVYWETIAETSIQMAQRGHAVPESFHLHFWGNIGSSLVLMLVGFITAFFFRSPITALIVTVPLMLACVWGFGFYMASVEHSIRVDLVINGAANNVSMLVTASVIGFSATVLVLGIILLIVARRRLIASESNLRHRVAGGLSQSAYQPPITAPAAVWYDRLVIAQRPGKFRALVWQHLQQSRWQLFALVAIALVCICFAGVLSNSRFVQPLPLMAISLSLYTIFSLTFYADNVRGRSAFFYDRGISPTLVWLSRIVVTSVATAVIMGFAAIVMLFSHASVSEVINIVSLVAFAYAISQLISQWSPRPVLTFFAAPTATCVAALVLASLFEFYEEAIPVLIVPASLLLYASWRQAPSWMSRQATKFANMKYLGYFCVALIVPYVLVISATYVSLPAERAAWRASLAETRFPGAGESRSVTVLPGSLRYSWKPKSYWIEDDVRAEVKQRIQKELESEDAVGSFVSFDELTHYSPFSTFGLPDGGYSQTFGAASEDDHIQRDYLVIRVLLKWSSMVREEAIAGRVSFGVLSGCAEEADAVAIDMLAQHIHVYGMNDQLQEMIDALPSPETMIQSRRYALINEWQHPKKALPRTTFLRHENVPTQAWLFVERMRVDRYRDEATKWLLDYWASNRSSSGSLEHSVVTRYLANAHVPYRILTQESGEPYRRLTVCDSNDRAYRNLKREIN